jgi:hypothetical protein
MPAGELWGGLGRGEQASGLRCPALFAAVGGF